MKREALDYLSNWKKRDSRKPLMIRGARQVGKTFLVRQFAQLANLNLFEINLEQQADYIPCFQSKDPKKILALLEIKSGQKIIAGQSLLFLDELQAAPEVLPSLRYFYEQFPKLHVITTGSLLDFMLEDHSFSMPVGRIEYLHLAPFSFKEFLVGNNRSQLAEFISQYEILDDFSEVIHSEIMNYYKLYLVIGGMPEAIMTYNRSSSLLEVNGVQQALLSTYRDDFTKYSRRFSLSTLQTVYQKLPFLVGQKIKYTNIDRGHSSAVVKRGLSLLSLAKIYTPIYHSSSNGIPLKGEMNPKFEKPLFLDVGLMNKSCGLSYLDIEKMSEVELVNSGAVSEQFVGQQLLSAREFFDEPELYYWCREKTQSSAEIDYVITIGRTIIPVEVKSGKTGSLKSLSVFIKEKGLSFAIRFNSAPLSLHDTKLSLPNTKGSYKLLSLPLYMAEEIYRLGRMAL